MWRFQRILVYSLVKGLLQRLKEVDGCRREDSYKYKCYELVLKRALGTDPYISNHECEAVGLLAFRLLGIAMGLWPFKKAFILTDNKGVLRRLSNPKTEETSAYSLRSGRHGKRNKASDLLANEATERNDHPDRRLQENANKLVLALKKQVTPQEKKTQHRLISDLPIAFAAIINQLASAHSPLNDHLFKAKGRLDLCFPHHQDQSMITR
ncbi:uncharacterized protein VP01_2438g3 [Puccinia sorghi]|uniref:Uncharacterized protein n=1 Tax=Puccinia sorghi TaxID=27349 RepID=A0A0L6V849_9BASI|nr:uncharacterized protein VP01_2438g3 [Puccinia sorghi]